MALLNKLFFPSSTTTTTPSPPVSTQSSFTLPSQTKSLSRTSSLANLLPSNIRASPVSAPTSSLFFHQSIADANFADRNRKNNCHQTTHSKNYLRQFPFDGSQVRILVYRECDSRGRRLLFDSNALEKVYLNKNNENIRNKHNVKSTTRGHSTTSTTFTHNNNYKGKLGVNTIKQTSMKSHSNGSFIEVCEEYGFKHNRPNSSDISGIGEMVFGALAMSFRGTSLKVHWLEEPSRILFSQVFLSPNNQSNGQSPYSTVSTSNLATPRASISSEHGSIDGFSMNSFSLPFSGGIDRQISLTSSDISSSIVSSPLDVPSIDLQSIFNNNGSIAGSEPRFSSTHSTGNDSGYSTLSVGPSSSDQWSASYQYSTRSSLGSVTSNAERLRKFSIDSNFFTGGTFSSGSNLELCSDSSLRRRISRNVMTSFENQNSLTDLIGYVTENYSNIGIAPTPHGGSEGNNVNVNSQRHIYFPSESCSNPEMYKRREQAYHLKARSRKPRIGLAICLTMSESFEEEMEVYCSEHIALVESMLSRLRSNTERAYIHHNHFLQIMFQNWQNTQQWFLDLFTAPRIKCPVWLSITTSGSKYSKNVAERFVRELCWLLSLADTKDTNFFISTMLTAILTHHLGWVNTVSPFNSSSLTVAIEQRAKLLKVSQKHPYNALWAQMGDLFGAIGLPLKLTRTVVYGTDKLSVERLLNVLTYFIRCGEIRRSSKKEDFDKVKLQDMLAQKQNSTKFKTNSPVVMQNRSEGVLTRTSSHKQDLNSIISEINTEILESRHEGVSNYDGDEEQDYNALVDEAIKTCKMNEIPTVLAFRDSRFVQQELRIGNYLMDTGIEKNAFHQYQQLKQKEPIINHVSGGQIRLTVTTPYNVELHVDHEHLDQDGALEAIEMEPIRTEASTHFKLQDNKNVVNQEKSHFWEFTSSAVEEGLSLNEVNKIQHCSDIKQNEKLMQDIRQDNNYPHVSLSDLITQNSMGKSERMTWGIEPIKENLSLEEKIHFKNIELDHDISNSKEKTNVNGVVFVLGENEPLVNIKKSNDDLTEFKQIDSSSLSLVPQGTSNNQLCSFHQGIHSSVSNSHQQMSKKHSGVKFNFEQYPQIVTNYMKSKNLLLSNYDLLMDKCSKFELQGSGCALISTNLDKSTAAIIHATQASKSITNKNTFPTLSATETAINTPTNIVNNCMVCKTQLNAYQTPSNATELEFETDEVHSFTNTNLSVNSNATATASTFSLPTVSSQTSVQTLISSISHGNSEESYKDEVVCRGNTIESGPACTIELEKNEGCKKPFNTNQEKYLAQLGSISAAPAKCPAANEEMHLLKLSIPRVKELPQEETLGDMKLPAGFVPSLFLSVNNHYVPDMVLQGTLTSPEKWETNLREDLSLAAHSASLISLPAENIAIIANMENWDVKILSSQTQPFPYAGGQSAPVGMSQLVSTMLETVQTMNNAGISAYECLSFMESKLQEIYLHSETLAAFLLETDFCSLSAVTTALNLSENDVPLLLSIAAIHTPQISRKCGISFR